MHRHEYIKPPPLPSWYIFGRGWARDQSDAAHHPHWQLLLHLFLWIVIAAVMVSTLLR
jgi:hypothetical protein